MENSHLTAIHAGDLLADAAYQQLSEAILRNELPPGSSLSVPELARRFGISRSPVREAVQRLIYDGLADYRGRRGTVVSSIDIPSFLDLLDVRQQLEGMAARLAAERGTDAERDHLGELQGRLERFEPEDIPLSQFVDLDMEFHACVREMARNQELSTFLSRTQARAHLSMNRLWAGPRNAIEVRDEHRNITDAIVAGDTNRAERAGRAHIEGLRRRTLHAVDVEQLRQ